MRVSRPAATKKHAKKIRDGFRACGVKKVKISGERGGPYLVSGTAGFEELARFASRESRGHYRDE